MTGKHIVIFILMFLVLSLKIDAQKQYTSSSNRAIRFYETAVSCFDKYDLTCVIENLERAINADKYFIEAYLVLAEAYLETGEKEKHIEYYEQGLNIDPDFHPVGFFSLANSCMGIGWYEKALTNYKIFKNYVKEDDSRYEQTIRRIKNCEFAIDAMENPVPFEPVNLGDSINSIYDEYWPSLSADEQTLVITVRYPIDFRNPAVFRNRREDFFISHKKNGEWTEVVNMGAPINTQNNEGAQSLSPDGSRMYFTACNRPDGLGECDIYFAEKENGKWKAPVNLGPPVNTPGSEKQPSISPDGRILYFASNRPGSVGGSYDLWKSYRNDDGTWTDPENLGDSINTPGTEQSPFIHHDNHTIYFSSNGHIGMGGQDLYVSRKNDGGIWGTPVNLGYPINTWNDEIGLIVNAAGDKAFFASNRDPEMGLDIYKFDLYEQARPVPVSYMKGTVYDADTGKPLKARFELIDLTSATIINEALSAASGEFLVTIPSDNDYALNVSKTGYLFYSDNFSLKGIYEISEPFLMDIPLKPIQIGKNVILKNIFFETGSYDLRNESIAELRKLVQFLNQNPNVSIEISGHTDNIGTEAYNIDLSEKRAEAVLGYLLDKGIDSRRLGAKGYGMALPISTNESEEGRSLNRRTEFKIIEK